ncbi:MAG: prepilin-type N-terminal cleavage/methylation domain-containing protein [Planctomycetota bacterium]
MSPVRRPISQTESDQGFTLIEVLVSLAILALVLTVFLNMRTNAVIDAAIARDWRIAREIAETQLSEMAAGAREFPPETGESFEHEDYPYFQVQILVGEDEISQAESDIAQTMSSISEDGERSQDRREWQQEREDLRRARGSGQSLDEFRQTRFDDEFEERVPSEDEFEDVAVLVTFPNLLFDGPDVPEYLHLLLRRRLSTMAIEGLTPEQAADIRAEQGIDDGATSGGG